MGRKKLVRKPEPPSKRGLAWPRWTGFRGMTVRDWLQLLVVPLALVGISLLFAAQQDQRQQKIENKRATQAQKIENKRADAERELAEQRTQDEVLQAYLDQMSTLMLNKDLRDSKEDSEVRTLARARTLTVFRRVDTSRTSEIMQFLAEADLVHRVGGSAPVIDLEGAHLGGANLSWTNLRGANLDGAHLRGANLSGTNLEGANLSSAHLEGTHLGGVDLIGADLRGAELRGDNLSFAFVSSAQLSFADLRDAKLVQTSLTDAVLVDTDLTDANLKNTYLSGADLSSADGVSNEELEQQTKFLKGATMPNDQKYENWLKDKKR